MIESGGMMEAICNVVGEIKTAFTDPDQVKFGLKEAQYLVNSCIGRDEKVDIIIQCTSKVNKQNKYVGFTVADEQVLKLVCLYLQMRLDRKASQKEVK
jgi:hypothetical protein